MADDVAVPSGLTPVIREAAALLVAREKAMAALRECQAAPVPKALGFGKYSAETWDVMPYSAIRSPNAVHDYWVKAASEGRVPAVAPPRLRRRAVQALEGLLGAVLDASGAKECRLFEVPWNPGSEKAILCLQGRRGRGGLVMRLTEVPYSVAAADGSLGQRANLLEDETAWWMEPIARPNQISIPVLLTAALRSHFPGHANQPPTDPRAFPQAWWFSTSWRWVFDPRESLSSPALALAAASHGWESIEKRRNPNLAFMAQMMVEAGKLPQAEEARLRELLAKWESLPLYPRHLRGAVELDDDGMVAILLPYMDKGHLAYLDENEFKLRQWRVEFPESAPFSKADVWAVWGLIRKDDEREGRIESIPLWVLTRGRDLVGPKGQAELTRDQAILNWLAFGGPNLPQAVIGDLLKMEAGALRKAMHDLRKKRRGVGLGDETDWNQTPARGEGEPFSKGESGRRK